jgi:hypothetical protein
MLQLKLHQGRDLIQNCQHYPAFILLGTKDLAASPPNSGLLLAWANTHLTLYLSNPPVMLVLGPPRPSPGISSFLCLCPTSLSAAQHLPTGSTFPNFGHPALRKGVQYISLALKSHDLDN